MINLSRNRDNNKIDYINRRDYFDKRISSKSK